MIHRNRHYTGLWSIILVTCILCIIAVQIHGDNVTSDIDTDKYTTSSCPVEECSCLGSYIQCRKGVKLDILPHWTDTLELRAADLTDYTILYTERLAQLTKLILSDNAFTRIPRLGFMPSLRKLTLASNKITLLRVDDVSTLPSLEELDLARNEIQALKKDALPASASLRKLRLAENAIVSLEEGALDRLTGLKKLDLDRNSIVSIPKSFFKNSSGLESLDLNRNKIATLEGLGFRGLTSLTTLKLRRNRIHTVMDAAFFGLDSIIDLHLDKNSIPSVKKGWIYGLASLQKLTLASNAIDTIESGCWEPAVGLRELDLSDNKLTAIRADTFEHLGELRTLRLDGNRISTVTEYAFRHLGKLEILRLARNRISWTVEDMNGPFAGLDRLTDLGLAENHVKSVGERAFTGLESLTVLDLSGNNVTSLQEKAFEPLKKLKKLRLNSTALVCDCSLQWAGPWLRSLSKNGELSALCAYPARYRGVSLLDLAEKNLTCDGSPKPKIIEHPKSQLAVRGKTATLRCTASAPAGELHFLWRRNNVNVTKLKPEEVASTGEDGMTRHTSELSIPSVGNSDSGKYQCVVSNGYGATYSQKARVNIVMLPKFLKKPTDITVNAGNVAKLKCAAEGEPTPEIAWQKDGGNDFPAARERRMHVIPTDAVFFIVNTKPADAGVYSCTAKNPAGRVTSDATLTVLDPPSFVNKMENKEVTAGDSAVLECMVSGAPKPTLAWFKDGVPLVDSGEKRHFFTAENQLLVIVDSRPADAGLYECEISNSLGTVRDSTELKILPPSTSVVNEEDMKGIIVITVVCCAVATSVVWVIIIYHTRKRSSPTPIPAESLPMAPLSPPEGITTQIFSDDVSEHSSCKDSGTGDSAKRSSVENLNAEEYAAEVPYVCATRVISREEENSLMRQQRPYFCASTSLDFEAATRDSITDPNRTFPYS